jgi:hypothetical protein
MLLHTAARLLAQAAAYCSELAGSALQPSTRSANVSA